MLKGMGVAAVGFSLTGALAGCGEKEAKKLANGEEAKLNFYNWDTYIGETTLEDYKQASEVDVNMTLFASNDELFAKLRAGNQGYDVIAPSNDFVERMASADMLMSSTRRKSLTSKMLPRIIRMFLMIRHANIRCLTHGWRLALATANPK